MKKFNTTKKLLAVAIGALSLVATHASASPTFTIDLDGSGSGTRTVVANDLSGTSSEYLTITGANTFSGTGWVQFTSLNLNSAEIANTSYTDTGLYATYSLTATKASYSPNGLGQPLSFYDVTSLSYQFFYDPTKTNSFVQSAAGNTAAPGTASVVLGNGDDVYLGGGTLVGLGVAGLYPNGGTSLNTSTTLTLSTLGADFFILPTPFYTYSLQGFSSTGGAFEFNPLNGGLAINNATGVVDFIPEPGSLALFGLALAGLGCFSSRRKQV